MGGICNCNQKVDNVSGMHAFNSLIRDPRLAELQTHLKIVDAKLSSNLNSIDDFR